MERDISTGKIKSGVVESLKIASQH